ncbi:MAG: UvrD-helicase domain-containing protein [Candidatus Binatia bacterium]|nr:UvrD-helicase domain-containing protein [Candidatus Binatia bacterium]
MFQRLHPLQCPLTGTVLIEASAGTGKTYTIANLYLRLLLERNLTVEQILVVTFTNAATAELRDRLRARVAALRECLRGGQPPDPDLAALAAQRMAAGTQLDDERRLQAALYGFDLAAIHTIHSFCQRMLERHAFEGGLPFEAELVGTAANTVSRLVRDFWVRQLESAPAEFLWDDEGNPGPLQRSLPLLEHAVGLALRYPDLRLLRRPEATGGWPAYRAALIADAIAWVRRELARGSRLRRERRFDDLLQELRDALRSPVRGLELAAGIREQFRAALIDEFQDTDSLQYDIFRTVYAGRSDTALFLIGDPKQAIYAFRGADVFAYLSGKQDADHHFTLEQNWRSVPQLVEAVNLLFSEERTERPFLLAGIEYHPIQPALPAISDAHAGLEILFVPAEDGKAITKAWAEKELCHIVAQDICKFVRRVPAIGPHTVSFASIAVLCRTNDQAAAMQRALAKLGIPSALEGELSVFETSEAMELECLLRALVDPGDGAAVRAALATSFFGLDAAALAHLQTADADWDSWVQLFFDWHRTWREQGFMSALQQVFTHGQAARRFLKLVDGERRMTNVRHLAELLHTASVEQRLSPERVLEWLALMRRDPSARSSDIGLGEAAQLRLESDEHAVKLVTIHKAKGLQYPVVYCPFLWDFPKLRDEEAKLPCFHDPKTFELCLDLREPPDTNSLWQAWQERKAEDARLLYVALTRAQYRCVVVWGHFAAAPESPLARLLHPGRLAMEKKGSGIPKMQWAPQFKDGVEDWMLADLQKLARAANGSIRVRRWRGSRLQSSAKPQASAAAGLKPRVSRRAFTVRWQIASFSALTEKAKGQSSAAEGFDFDAALAPRPVPLAKVPDAPLLLRLAAGGRIGEALHRLFEVLDFASPLAGQIDKHADLLRPLGEEVEPVTLAQALEEVVHTPLDPLDFRLCDVARRKRLNELDFWLPVCTSGQATPSSQPAVVPQKLGDAFAQHAADPLLRAYGEQLAELDFLPWVGFLKGYMDLVFEHEGRWFVADYKSNFLGPTAADYSRDALVREMRAQHYVLQYHLYAVALHRMLQTSVPNYSYERDFGGVFYLFVRGMSPAYPRGNGVYFDRPPLPLMESLLRVFTGEDGV